MIQPHEAGGLNPEDLISGHNGEKQILTVKRTLVVTKPNGRTQMIERICEDQWGNVYLVYSAKLSDREVYEVADYLKPSTLQKYGGFNDALLDDFRAKAFHAFAESEKELNAMRANAEKVADMIAKAAVNVSAN
jgi:hypothetical protein